MGKDKKRNIRAKQVPVKKCQPSARQSHTAPLEVSQFTEYVDTYPSKDRVFYVFLLEVPVTYPESNGLSFSAEIALQQIPGFQFATLES